MKRALARLSADLGVMDLVSLALIAATALFLALVLRPLQDQAQRLEREAIRRTTPSEGFKLVGAGAQAIRVAAFYRFFDRQERADEWLAKLYGIATANGLELRTGEYRLTDSGQRLERYRISLPVTGSYSQIRGFLEASLAEIPVLSLDQASFRRKAVSESRIEADLVLTLHWVRQ